MGKKNPKVIEGRTREDRKKVRKTLGTLKSLSVQPVTRKRYQSSLDQFYDYLRGEQLELPKQRDKLDGIVGDYLEYLWSQGEGRASGSNLLAALQDVDPHLKGHLPGSWRLMKTWAANEIPNRAPPLTENVLKAMIGWSIFNQHFTFGLSLLVGFYSLLRTGELLNLQAWSIHMTSSGQPAVISLGLTKTGKRQGAAESVTLTERTALKLLWHWKQTVPEHTFLTAKPHVWRQMFNQCISELKLDDWGFRPYSLRRGGATSLFVKCGSLDQVLLLGRWTAVRTAKIYLNSGLAMLADLQISPKLLRPFHTVLSNYLLGPPQLEPSLRTKRRPGGRGMNKKAKRSKKWVPEGPAQCFFFSVSTVARGSGSSGLAEPWGATGGCSFPLVWQGLECRGPFIRHFFMFPQS